MKASAFKLPILVTDDLCLLQCTLVFIRSTMWLLQKVADIGT